MDTTDAELVAAFARNRSEDAFRELVRRHLGMVFATARRLLGDAHQAEEIAQTVFQLFAEKAGTIEAGQPLAGWLYHATRHHALHRVRSESRRRQREQLAAAMNPAAESAPPPPLLAELEDALTELAVDERDALVLRFLEDRQLREVGRELGVSEEAARKRVARALDRLRDVFAHRGITASTGAITVALLGQAGVGVPATLGATITTTVLGGTAVAATTAALVTETASTTMNLFNLKTAAAILGAAAVTGTTTYLVQEREADRLRADYQTINEAHGKLAARQQEALAMIQLRDEQIAALKRDIGELPRLRGEVDDLNRKIADLTLTKDKMLVEREQMSQALESLQRLLAEVRGKENPDRPIRRTLLETREYRIQSDPFLAELRRQAPTDSNGDNATSLVVHYLRANGFLMEPPNTCYFNESTGKLLVRADIQTLDWLGDAIARLGVAEPVEP